MLQFATCVTATPRPSLAESAGAPSSRRLPAELPPRGHENAVSLELGPLVLAVPHEEEWKRVGGEPFGDWGVRTASSWNYGLREQDIEELAEAFKVTRGEVPPQRWASGTAPGTL